jgi:iron(III) transport system ATP-binding protein
MADLQIENVTKKYGDFTAVSDFSLAVNNGEFVTLLGPSGCGKTTLLRSIAGFFPITAGTIAIGGRRLSDPGNGVYVAPEKRNLGMVFQSYAVWPHMNVFDNIAYPLKVHRRNTAEIAKSVGRVLDLLNLKGQERKNPSELSGGQQQRVALGRALVVQPDVLLLDEPLSNLDAKLRDKMRFELKEIQRTLNLTIVYVTHDQDEAMAVSDRIVLMEAGQIRQIDQPRRMYQQPANLFSARFIGRSNFILGTLTSLNDGTGEIEVAKTGARIPVRVSPQIEAEAGDKVEGVIRYQRVEVTREKRSDAIEAEVVLGTYLGNMVLYEFDTAAGRFIVQTEEETVLKEGETVNLVLNNVHVFRQEDQE